MMTYMKEGVLDVNRKSKAFGRTSYDRPIAYDREIFIEICRRLIMGLDLDEICSKPPTFLGWAQDHKEARANRRL